MLPAPQVYALLAAETAALNLHPAEALLMLTPVIGGNSVGTTEFRQLAEAQQPCRLYLHRVPNQRVVRGPTAHEPPAFRQDEGAVGESRHWRLRLVAPELQPGEVRRHDVALLGRCPGLTRPRAAARSRSLLHRSHRPRRVAVEPRARGCEASQAARVELAEKQDEDLGWEPQQRQRRRPPRRLAGRAQAG